MARKPKLGTLAELKATGMSTVLDHRTNDLSTAPNYADAPEKLKRLAVLRRLHELRMHPEISAECRRRYNTGAGESSTEQLEEVLRGFETSDLAGGDTAARARVDSLKGAIAHMEKTGNMKGVTVNNGKG